MSFLSDRALDAALQVVVDETTRLVICSTEPISYLEATETYLLGYKEGPTFGAIGDRTAGGRAVETDAVTDGTVLFSDDAVAMALVDMDNSRLLATKALDSTVAVMAGNTFSLTALEIGIPDAA